MNLLTSVGKRIQFAIESENDGLELSGLYASTVRAVGYKEGLALLTLDRITLTSRPNNWYTENIMIFKNGGYDCTVYQILNGVPKNIRTVSCTDWKLLD